MSRKPRLRLEYLEDRTVPSTTAVTAPTPAAYQGPTPWADPTHITISFAPDGTSIASGKSDLFATLNAQEPTAVWQGQILAAAQAWSSVANIDFAVVPDGGQAFGAPGLPQGDPRFGDIRIGAEAMAPSSLASTVMPRPSVAGTWAGDIVLNDTANFTSSTSNLYSVMVHEIGHALGLYDSNNPRSVMYRDATTQPHDLVPSDIRAIQALYGPRPTTDSPNNTLLTATPFSTPTNSDDNGALPVLGFGNIAIPGDANFYRIQGSQDHYWALTVHVITSGISLLDPQLTIYDVNGNVVNQAQSTSQGGGVVSITLPRVSPGDVYYLEVQGAVAGTSGVGHYGMAVIDGMGRFTAAIDRVLEGPYQSLPERQLQQLLMYPQGGLSGEDDSQASSQLQQTPGSDPGWYYQAFGNLQGFEGSTSSRVTAPVPADGGPLVMTISIQSDTVAKFNPTFTILDANLHPLTYTVLAHDTGTFTIQATGMVPGATYTVRFGFPPDGPQPSGNYSLTVNFGESNRSLATLSHGTIDAAHPQRSTSLYVANTQLFNFLLQGTAPSAPAGTLLQMVILDQNGNTVFQLQAPPGTPMSGSVFLTPGAYQVVFSTITPSWVHVVPPVHFALEGIVISDPIGPSVTDPTGQPLYKLPGSNLYKYPPGILSPLPYLILALAL
jgi:hypothetical protein